MRRARQNPRGGLDGERIFMPTPGVPVTEGWTVSADFNTGVAGAVREPPSPLPQAIVRSPLSGVELLIDTVESVPGTHQSAMYMQLRISGDLMRGIRLPIEHQARRTLTQLQNAFEHLVWDIERVLSEGLSYDPLSTAPPQDPETETTQTAAGGNTVPG